MKKAYWLTVLFCLTVALMLLPGVAPAQQQTANSATDASNFVSNGMGMMMPFRSYAQYAFDLVLRYQNEFIGSALDPDEYIVGPGDRFTVSFVSSDIGNIECQVNLGGQMFVKSVGSVDLKQKTLREALAIIRQAVDTRYKGTEFAVEMSGFRFVPVYVIGEVTNPGIYYAPAPWRASAVIDLAGGLTPDALSRKIVLRGEGKSLPVDLVRFDAVGDKTANPMVCAGNTIYVPNRKECTDYVAVAGLVNRPGVFAALKEDRISDYLMYAGGVAGNLDDMTVAIPGRVTRLFWTGRRRLIWIIFRSRATILPSGGKKVRPITAMLLSSAPWSTPDGIP
jgi:protein involved in polysaccharide export with SLBB domain